MDARVVRVNAVEGAPTSVAVMWTTVTGSPLVQLAKLLDYIRTQE